MKSMLEELKDVKIKKHKTKKIEVPPVGVTQKFGYVFFCCLIRYFFFNFFKRIACYIFSHTKSTSVNWKFDSIRIIVIIIL